MDSPRLADTRRTRKLTLSDLVSMKRRRERVAWTTAYDLPLAYAAEQAGVDMILVGDSGGMVQLGYPTTNPVTMDEMVMMARAARRGAPQTFLVGDMPQGSYEIGERDAVVNALRFVKEAGCDAVKCEGGRRIATKVRAMADAGLLVMGHLGLTPQTTACFGGYRVQGKTLESFERTVEDALALQEAGIFALLLEAIPQEPAAQIAAHLDVPVYGIGAGADVDGQLMIVHDLMGFYEPFRPWFAKCYVPEVIDEFARDLAAIPDLKKAGREERRDGLLRLAEMALRRYVEEVRSLRFPGADYVYPIKETELSVIRQSKYWRARPERAA